MTNGPPSQRDRRSLQDLAKLASSSSLGNASKTPAPAPVAASKPELDSGIVDLKVIASADAGAAARAKTTPLASAPLFEEEGSGAAPPSSSGEKGAAPASSGPGSSPQAAGAGAKLPTARRGPLAYIVVGLGLAVIAAGGFTLARELKGRPHAPAPVATESPVAVTSPASAVPAAAASATAAPSVDQAVAASPSASVDTSQGAALPGAGAHKVTTAATKTAPVGVTGSSGAAGVSGLTASMAQIASAQAAQPSGAPPAAGELGQALQHAAGAAAVLPPAGAQPAQPTAPQFAPGSVPEKPSQGAVTSALQRALPDARSCLNSDDPPAKANITFASAGSVTSVVVSGAAGAATESCIKKALSKASVPPFAQATYSANVTVRPN